MKEYLVTLIVVGSLISLALCLMYKEDKEGLGAVKTAFSILLLYVTVVPLIGMIRNFDAEKPELQIESIDFDTDSALEEVSENAYIGGVRSFVSEEFSLNIDDISVTAEGFDVMNMRAERLTVILSGDAALADYRAIRERLLKNGFEGCEVKIEVR